VRGLAIDNLDHLLASLVGPVPVVAATWELAPGEREALGGTGPLILRGRKS
jgi:hypothetical protein